MPRVITLSDVLDAIAAEGEPLPAAHDPFHRGNAIDAIDYLLDDYQLGFVLTVIIEREGIAKVRGALNRIAEMRGQIQPARGES